MFQELGLLNHNLQDKRRWLIFATLQAQHCDLAAPLVLFLRTSTRKANQFNYIQKIHNSFVLLISILISRVMIRNV